MALKVEGGGVNQALGAKLFGHSFACAQCLRNFLRREWVDIASDWEIAEVRVWCNFAGWDPRDAGVAGEVDSVGDDGGGGVGLGSGSREDGDGVGDAEREAAAAPAAGGDSADASRCGNLYGAEERGSFGVFDHADFVALLLVEMNRDVAPVVYIGATELRGVGHCVENGISDGAGHSGHGSDEAAMAIRQNSVEHATGDGACRRRNH